MSIQFKKYRSTRSENFEAILAKVGVKPEAIKQGLSTTTTVQLIKEPENSYSFNSAWSSNEVTIKFNLNEEFDEQRPDGTKVKSVITFEGNKMIQQQKGEHAMRVERVFTDKELIATSTIDGVVGTRWFEAIE